MSIVRDLCGAAVGQLGVGEDRRARHRRSRSRWRSRRRGPPRPPRRSSGGSRSACGPWRGAGGSAGRCRCTPLNMATGTLTSPKLSDPVQSERGIRRSGSPRAGRAGRRRLSVSSGSGSSMFLPAALASIDLQHVLRGSRPRRRSGRTRCAGRRRACGHLDLRSDGLRRTRSRSKSPGRRPRRRSASCAGRARRRAGARSPCARGCGRPSGRRRRGPTCSSAACSSA